MKRISAIILAVLMVVGLVLSVNAVSALSKEKENNNSIDVSFFPGYVHIDKNSGSSRTKCNTAAARDILRYSAGLEELKDYQITAADVNFDGEVTAADARILLRYCAKLGGFPVTLRVGQELKFGPFNGWWKLVSLTESSDKLRIEREIIPIEISTRDGDSAKHILHVTPSEPGTYTFEAVYIGYTDEVEKSALFEITCIE